MVTNGNQYLIICLGEPEGGASMDPIEVVLLGISHLMYGQGYDHLYPEWVQIIPMVGPTEVSGPKIQYLCGELRAYLDL